MASTHSCEAFPGFEWCLGCGRQLVTLWTENVGVTGNLGGYTYSTPASQLHRHAVARQPRAFANTLDTSPLKRRRHVENPVRDEGAAFKKPRIGKPPKELPVNVPAHMPRPRPRLPKGFKVHGALERGIHTALLRMIPYWPVRIDTPYEQLHSNLVKETHGHVVNARRFVFARLIELFPTRTALAARACGISKRYAAVTLRLWRIDGSC